MLEYIGVALKLGSRKSNQLLKDFLIPSAYLAGKGGGTTQAHQESWQHEHDTETHDCFNSVVEVTLRNWPTLANILIQAIISLFCRQLHQMLQLSQTNRSREERKKGLMASV